MAGLTNVAYVLEHNIQKVCFNIDEPLLDHGWWVKRVTRAGFHIVWLHLCVMPQQLVDCEGWGLEGGGAEVIQSSEVSDNGFTVLSTLTTTKLYISKGWANYFSKSELKTWSIKTLT